MKVNATINQNTANTNMEEKIMNKNIARVLEKFEIESTDRLEEILTAMPKEYREVFTAKFGIDEAGNYCPTHTLLAKKLGCDIGEATKMTNKATSSIEICKYLLKAFTDTEYDMEKFNIAWSYLFFLNCIFGTRGYLPEEVKKMSVAEMKKTVDEMIKNFLTDREQKIIISRFGLESGEMITLEQAGKIYNVTQDRILWAESKALRKLRYETSVLKKPSCPKKKTKETTLSMSDGSIHKIEDINLPLRTYNNLKKEGITSLEDMSNLTYWKLLESPNFRELGIKKLTEVLTKMKEVGIELDESLEAFLVKHASN